MDAQLPTPGDLDDVSVEIVCGTCRGASRLTPGLYRFTAGGQTFGLDDLRMTMLSVARRNGAEMGVEGAGQFDRDAKVAEIRRLMDEAKDLPPLLAGVTRGLVESLAGDLTAAPQHMKQRGHQDGDLSFGKTLGDTVALRCRNNRCQTVQRFRLIRIYRSALRARDEGRDVIAFPDDIAGA